MSFELPESANHTVSKQFGDCAIAYDRTVSL